MIALRDFSYLDHRTGKSVVIQRGATIDEAALTSSKCDLEKLVRTKYTGQETVIIDPPKKRRGRPPKQHI